MLNILSKNLIVHHPIIILIYHQINTTKNLSSFVTLEIKFLKHHLSYLLMVVYVLDNI